MDLISLELYCMFHCVFLGMFHWMLSAMSVKILKCERLGVVRCFNFNVNCMPPAWYYIWMTRANIEVHNPFRACDLCVTCEVCASCLGEVCAAGARTAPLQARAPHHYRRAHHTTAGARAAHCGHITRSLKKHVDVRLSQVWWTHNLSTRTCTLSGCLECARNTQRLVLTNQPGTALP